MFHPEPRKGAFRSSGGWCAPAAGSREDVMKKFALITLAIGIGVWAQQPPAPQPKARAMALDIGNVPTAADMYCSGFIASDHISEGRYVAAGWNSPYQTRFAAQADYIYIHGKDMKEGDRLQILRRVRDPNRYEFYSGQHSAVSSAGEPYFELGIVRVIDVQKNTAIVVPELACSDFVPGDIAVPFVEREAPKFRKVSLDRFAPPNGKTTGRIIMGADFVGYVGTKDKVYLNIGSDKGIKVGDYLRATRTYSYTYHDPEAGLAMKASAYEDTQKSPPQLSMGELSTLPRRTLGDMMVLNVHKHSATAMILTALDAIQVGDGVELMDVENAPEIQPVRPASAAPPAPVPGVPISGGDITTAQPPRITCTASPATIRVGETSLITCDATSPDNRPVSIAFVANGGRLSSSRNQATLDTTDTGPGPITVRATAIDDRQLNATAVTTVNVEAAALPAPTAQKLSDLEFKPNSAYVDNRSKAILDDVALKMQQDPQSTVVLTGSTEELEPPRLAEQRADNAKTYLTKSKGIDPARIQAKGAGPTGRKVEIIALPAGVPAQEQPQPPQPPKQE